MQYQFDDENHIHTLDGRPLMGTSTAVGVMAKNLTWWAAELATIECLEAGTHIPTIREEYLAVAGLPQEEKKRGIDALQKKYPIFKQARFAHFNKKNDTAKAGTDLHAELEDFVKGRMGKAPVREYDTQIQPFIDWTNKNVKKFLWSEAHCYSEKMWVGGISDCGAELNDGSIVVIDFKSAKNAFDNHFIQIAGYDLQISENGLFSKDGKVSTKLNKPISAYIVVPFGAEKIEPVYRYNVEELRRGFEACVVLYKITNK